MHSSETVFNFDFIKSEGLDGFYKKGGKGWQTHKSQPSFFF